ncbi:MAG: GGDEF and EAL domain-containing protein, partial [Myxococcales bacterium]|nr:GGDEF and EAL domain-containing protein [Myxococcales bacterium]
HVLQANPAAERATGLSYDELVSTPLYRHFPALREPLDELLSGRRIDVELVVSSAPPRGRRARFSMATLPSAGHPARVLCHCSASDGAAHDNAVSPEAELGPPDADGLWYWDLRADVFEVSPRFAERLGLGEGASQMTVKDWLGRIHPDDRELAVRLTKLLRDGHSTSLDVRYRVRDGEGIFRPLRVRGLGLREKSGRAHRMAGSFTDYSHVEQIEQQMLHALSHDPLTGLPNRRRFVQRLEGALRRRERGENHDVVVVLANIDRLRTLVTSMGHQAADRALCEAATRLRRCVRANDLVARFAADEFAILLEDFRGNLQPEICTTRIRNEFRVPFRLGENHIPLRVSLGLSASGDARHDADALLRQATVALSDAKHNQDQSIVTFEANRHRYRSERFQLEIALSDAVERRAFELHYQPILTVVDGAVSGFEALLRWSHPSFPGLTPTDFVPILEESGLIVPLGYWIIENAALQLKAWQMCAGGSTGWTMSINLSPRQLGDGDLAHWIQTLCEQLRLAPGSLNLEITESSFLDLNGGALGTLEDLSQTGVRLWLDDFGTGYSSLSVLQQFPVQGLKLDRSFVSGIESLEQRRTFLRAIVQLAVSLDLPVIAEGVENSRQLHVLSTTSCDLAQGFYFSHPQRAGALENYLRIRRDESASGEPHR